MWTEASISADSEVRRKGTLMNEGKMMKSGRTVRIFYLNTVIVGSGAAAFNAADRLFQFGQQDIALVTEGVNAGTGRNTGSDKQTYFKLTLSGAEEDSVRSAAETLKDGGCMDGDTALCEASLSARCFLRLLELGVPFPENRYGEAVGYRTDHDRKLRATSAGPFTSRFMTEALERSVRGKDIRIFDRMQAVRILSDGKKAYGVLCIDLQNQENPKERYVCFFCTNIIWATGGPAGIYRNSVYPLSQHGATGIALRAGAKGQNLTEWQYGLSSVNPRWNVSGTYMQVLPKFLSVNADGSGRTEFLNGYFDDRNEMLSRIFLKGYEWPFDVSKAAAGSSVIDLLVYREISAGKRVYLDFTANPGNAEIDFDHLSPEAGEYLRKADACFGTPVERLIKMNEPAYEFYKGRGVNLKTTPLEISLSAQHNNGGLSVDLWWRTGVEGLFAAGEAAGTHGVKRPGGSALNAGQVGSLRAAQYIAACRKEMPEQERHGSEGTGEKLLAEAVRETEEILNAVIRQDGSTEKGEAESGKADSGETGSGKTENGSGRMNPSAFLSETTGDMSLHAAAFRGKEELRQLLSRIRERRKNFKTLVRSDSPADIGKIMRLYDCIFCEEAYVTAMLAYLSGGGKSRGSALYPEKDGEVVIPGLPEFSFSEDKGRKNGKILEILYTGKEPEPFQCSERDVRPIPEEDGFFENVWRDYRRNKNIF